MITIKIRNETRVFTLSVPVQYNSDSKRVMKGKKAIDLKRRNLVSRLADGMVLYIEGLKDSTRKLLKHVNTFHKVSGYPLIPAPRRQSQEDLCEIEGSLVYTEKSRPSGATGSACLKNT